jgi:hypothetical protein
VKNGRQPKTGIMVPSLTTSFSLGVICPLDVHERSRSPNLSCVGLNSMIEYFITRLLYQLSVNSPFESLSGLKLVWDVKLVAIIKGWPSINMKVIIHCLGIFSLLFSYVVILSWVQALIMKDATIISRLIVSYVHLCVCCLILRRNHDPGDWPNLVCVPIGS